MTAQTKPTLKTDFSGGQEPPASAWADLIDTIGVSTLMVAASNATDAEKGRADYVCDGSADDVQINAAIEALPTDGGKIQLSRGVFYIDSTIRIDRNSVTLEGAGTTPQSNAASIGDIDGGTRLEATSNLASAEVILVETDTDTGHPPANTPLMGITLRDFSVDMVNADASATNGITFVAWRSLIDNVMITAAKDNGLAIHGYAGFAAADNSFFNIRVYNYGDAGIYMYTRGEDSLFANCNCSGGTHGIRIQAINNIFSGIQVYDNTIGVFCDNGGGLSKFVGCKFEDSFQHGLQLLASSNYITGVTISSCGFKNNSRTTTNTYDHINIDGGASAHSQTATIVGCNFECAGSNKARYGIYLGQYGGDAIITGNHFRASSGYGTAPIGKHASSVASLIRNNAGYKTENYGAAASKSDGSTIAHGMPATPTMAICTPSVASEMVSVTALDATNITVAIKKDDGTAGTSQTIYWRAWI